jgi:hypothetical protein
MEGNRMADQSSPIPFEDVPLDEARHMSRGPRMDPELYNALKQKIHSLDTAAVRMSLSEGTRPTTMKNRILRVAAALGMPVTIRRVPGGLLFWRSSEEDIRQARETASRLRGRRQQQTARKRPQARPRGRRRA